MANTAEFQLSVTHALRDQLLAALGSLDTAPLIVENLATVEERAGVYQLFVEGELVYVGKAASNLRKRLGQHHRKLSGRVGNILSLTTFKCVYVTEDLDAIAPEQMLISHYRSTGQAPWNFNGFGNNDPGKERDTSLVTAGHFDSMHSIDLDIRVEFQVETGESLRDAMKRFKGLLPYVFRFSEVPSGISIDGGYKSGASVRDWIGFFASALPRTWSVVALPGYVIAYPNRDSRQFPGRMGSWIVNEHGVALWESHTPEVVSASPDKASSDQPLEH